MTLHFLRLALGLGVVAALVGCSDTSFEAGKPSASSSKGGDAKGDKSGLGGDDGGGGAGGDNDLLATDEEDGSSRRIEKSFELAKVAGKVDMVWLIDTSGSMREEAAHVQRNFASFAATLSSRTNTRTTLIANPATNGDIGVTLPPGGVDQNQISTPIGSRNALAVAAAAVCPSNLSSVAGNNATICGEAISGVENANAIPTIAGRLKSSNFFRPGAKPVFVIVTDDDASGVTAANFVRLVQPHLNNEAPTVYSFRGQTSRNNCDVARPGAAYDALAAATSGRAFDICDTDWSPNFATLGQAVAELANTSFVMDTGIKSVLKVVVDGRELSSGDYTVTGNRIELRKGVVSADAKSLKIVYQSAPK